MKLIQSDYENNYHDHFLLREALNSQRNRLRLEALLAYKQSGRLLEIGCGKAGFLRLAGEHFEVEGVEISHHAVEALIPTFGERIRQANIEAHSLPQQRYDVIAAFNLLEHLRQPDRAIQRIFSALNEGGVTIGSMPNNYGLVGGVVTRLSNFVDRTHISTYTPEVWRGLFRQAGFSRVDFFGEVTIGRNRAVYVRRRFWPYVSFNLMFVCSK
jgi:2-polyprenyl-3-methyl-5-hydroxy-6-metoxy-1,4-benzoquinol methylase